MSTALRVWLVALLVLGVIGITLQRQQPHRVLGLQAPAGEFSAARARLVLQGLLGDQSPHPLGSTANAAVRARILQAFAAMGVPTRTHRAFTCNTWRGFSYVPCATVTDVIAQVLPGEGPAIVMMAHYDSVPAGPGAADDGANVAAVLEAARALRTEVSPVPRMHPVWAVLTDGEEAGLLGAHAFLDDAALRSRVGVLVNVEARGTSGSSLLFQTSEGDARLITLYASHMRAVSTSSLFAQVYRRLPNDTDLTLFLRQGYPGFNFAFAGNERYYHSPLDRLANLSAASLQMQGDSLLGVVRGLLHTPYASLRGRDAVYLSVLNAWVLQWPQRWVLPLAIMAFLGLAAAAWLSRRPSEAAARALPAALLLPSGLLGSVAAAWVLTSVAHGFAGTSAAGYANPWLLWSAVALGATSVTLLIARGLRRQVSASAVWLWLGALGVVVAAGLPAVSPYFVLPSACAALLLLVAARFGGGWGSPPGQLALLVAALIALLVWMGLTCEVGTLLGLDAAPLWAATFCVGLMSCVPLLAGPGECVDLRGADIVVSGALALLLALVAGWLPAYSTNSPQRVDLIYFQDAEGARWITDTSWHRTRPERLPSRLRSVLPFRLSNVNAALLGMAPAYAAPAASEQLPLPTISVIGDEQQGVEHRIMLHLRGSGDADAMLLYFPAAAHLRGLDLKGQHLSVPADWQGGIRLICASRDCYDLTMTLQLAASLHDTAWPLQFAEQRYRLPASGAALQQLRRGNTMPSQSGDQTVLASSIMLH